MRWIENLSRAWYTDTVSRFLHESPDKIIGRMTTKSAQDGFETNPLQVQAWQEEINILQQQLCQVDFSSMNIFLEFNIPRMGRRIDALILIRSNKPHIVILEFKAGANAVHMTDLDQVMDYALELKNFHEGSHGADIFPILIPTEYQVKSVIGKNTDAPEHKDAFSVAKDGIYYPQSCGADGIAKILQHITYTLGNVVPEEWDASPYKPTPTIVEAARALYANHDVNEITRSEGSAATIKITSEKLVDLVSYAKDKHKKVIAFVTGVPGAGKTLVGLKLATQKRDEDDETHAVFLSGNGPLVEVLQEALARDDHTRNGVTKTEARTKVKSFIQNVHHYRDEGLRNQKPPAEHVAIFDEAQRAWDKEKTTDFMKRRKGIPGFNQSEPEFLISCLDRHSDWALIVCLVGGGQEINQGEAGIGAWIEAILAQYPDWEIALSDRMTDAEYAAGHAVELAQSRIAEEPSSTIPKTTVIPELHLSVSMRSFRAENVSNFVKALLDIDTEKARAELAQFEEKYPIRLTRNLAEAKKWIRQQTQGTERPGLLASSKALRLKPFAIDTKANPNPIHFFLDGKDDPRSSYYLEAAASEFIVQGLELDYTLVAWDADLRLLSGKGKNNPTWSYHDFRGHTWQSIRNANNKSYLKNAYRVLLTRARQGMVIFVPLGNNPPDTTRDSSYYDDTYLYLKSLGIIELPSTIEDRGY